MRGMPCGRAGSPASVRLARGGRDGDNRPVMAAFRVHLSVASLLGAAYGSAGAVGLHLDWGPVFLGAGLTGLGGVMPDLYSDSGIPVRELFGLAAVVVPLMLVRRLHHLGLTPEQILAILAGVYILVRYVVSFFFKRWTVHRGMFHSIPAMLIAGLLIYLSEHHGDLITRLYLSGGVMIGFLSHLILDELYSVDFMGHTLRLNKYAGTAVKLWSPSWPATLLTYAILAALTLVAVQEFQR